jgi:hypothetical protein
VPRASLSSHGAPPNKNTDIHALSTTATQLSQGNEPDFFCSCAPLHHLAHASVMALLAKYARMMRNIEVAVATPRQAIAAERVPVSENGNSTANIGVAPVHRLLRATAPIAKGEQVLSVPRSACLSTDASPALLSEELRGQLKQHWQVALGACLLRETLYEDVSYWSEYIRLLPRRFDGLPLFFSKDQLRELQFEPFSSRCIARNRAVAQASASLGPLYSIQDLAWATACVSTRAFTLRETEDGLGGRYLVPVLDMANHAAAPTAHLRFHPESDCIELFATQPLAPGNELTISCEWVLIE